MTLEAEKLKQIINDAFDAVDKSRVGPMYYTPDPSDMLTRQGNSLAIQTFVIVLTGEMRNIKGDRDVQKT